MTYRTIQPNQTYSSHSLPLTPISTSFLFVLDPEWVMSTCEHQGRDTVLQTGLKLHWSRRSASSCFNRVWRVTKSSAKHQSMLRPWVMQHQPWPSPSAWTKTRSLHGCRNFYLLILPSLSFSLSFSLSLLLLILHRTDVCSPLLCLFPTQFRDKIDFSRKNKNKNAYCVVTVTPPSLQGLHV